MKLLYGKAPLIGFLLLSLWFADVYVKIFILHAPYRLLWFCSIGLLLTSLAFITRSAILSTAMFCSLFAIEALWMASFISYVLLGNDMFGMILYQSSNNMDFVVGVFYHLFLFPSLILGLFIRGAHPFGWIPASFFALVVGLLSIFFTRGGDNVNCVLNDSTCSKFFAPLYHIQNPERIFTAVALLTVIIFIPLNKALSNLNGKSILRFG